LTEANSSSKFIEYAQQMCANEGKEAENYKLNKYQLTQNRL